MPKLLFSHVDKNKGKGFTLIELLVVIAIIALLAAILFPVFARARENARRTSCMSNLKQMGLGVMQYSQDFDEGYPPGNYSWDSTGRPAAEKWAPANLIYWQQIIDPYTKSEQIYVCPSVSRNISGQPRLLYFHYGANRSVMRLNSNTPNTPLTMPALKAPASVYLILDAGQYTVTAATLTSPSTSYNYIPGGGEFETAGFTGETLKDFERGRHFTGVNMMFGDGHVKWLRNSIIYQQANSSGSGTWAPDYEP
jgi:prepilin-type N-terminal cleavage/methylation domain-containing protein/prepilin-type processing-associated H-X9-DG protein